jgi:hypothetical protein
MKPGEVNAVLDFVVNLMKCRTEADLMRELGVSEGSIDGAIKMKLEDKKNFVMEQYATQVKKVAELGEKGVFRAKEARVELGVLSVARDIYITPGALEAFKEMARTGNVMPLAAVLQDKMNVTAAQAFILRWLQVKEENRAVVVAGSEVTASEDEVIDVAGLRAGIEKERTIAEKVLRTVFNVDHSTFEGDIRDIYTERELKQLRTARKQDKLMSPMAAKGFLGSA